MANNKTPNGIPSAAQFGQLRAYLSRKGMSQAQITSAIGIKPDGRTRIEIANELNKWLKTEVS